MTEVRESVSRSDTKGLILFINGLAHDHLHSSAVSLDFRQRPKARYKTKISTILSTKEHAELKMLLWQIAKKCSTDAQYLLHHNYEFSSFDHQFLLEARAQAQESPTKENEAHLSKALQQYKKLHLQEIEKLANQGNRYAAFDLYEDFIGRESPDFEKSKQWLIRSAELNHPLALAELSFKYLHKESNVYTANNNCGNKPKHNVCLSKNITKGEHFLALATKHYLNNPSDHLIYFDTEIGKYLQEKQSATKHDIKQAYLWYRIALQSPEYYETRDAYLQIEKLYKQGYLSEIDPELGQAWPDQDARELLLKLQKNSPQEELVKAMAIQTVKKPIFSFEYSDFSPAKLDVYENGDVYLGVKGGGRSDNIFRGKLTTVSKKQVQAFVKELTDAGFNTWFLSSPLSALSSKICLTLRSWPDCRANFTIASLQEGNIKKSLQLTDDDQRYKKVFALVEQYFSTQKFRCELSGSQAYRAECNQYFLEIIKSRGQPA